MKPFVEQSVSNLWQTVVLFTAILLCPLQMWPFDLSVYARQSVLASGRWVKISVAQTGMHRISANDLRRWGFDDVAAVRVYGYGGNRISDKLSADEYIDDLPQVQCEYSDGGICFYAVGPESWSVDGSGHHTHKLNPFSSVGYYFLTDTADDGECRDIPTEGMDVIGRQGEFVSEYVERVMYESELSVIGESGHMLVGEDFRTVRSRRFSFDLPGKVDGADVWMRCRFVSGSASESQLQFSIDGVQLPYGSSDRAVPATSGALASLISTEKSFGTPRSTMELTIDYESQGHVSFANLDAIDLNYRRRIELGQDGLLEFGAGQTAVELAGASADTRVWDVTEPGRVVSMATSVVDGKLKWVNVYSGARRYVAWNPKAIMPQPKYVETVGVQNLHDDAVLPDMVVFSASAFMSEARRIAALHSQGPHGMEVLVVDQEEVFNEFSSGARDVGAFRRMLKMLYDRGVAAGRPLKYVLLLGHPTFDNRGVSAAATTLRAVSMPTWQTDESLRESESFTGDDMLAFLDDDSGIRPGADRLCVAVGRIPARNLAQARGYVDKLCRYVTDVPAGGWKNKVIVLADDGDRAEHMEQADRHIEMAQATTGGRRMMYDKIYLDAYDLTSGTCEGARSRLHSSLDAGAMWWTYIGHASKDYLTGQNVMNNADISNLYLKRLPVFYGATCSFLQWDGAEPSGGERLCFLENGGAIAAISATRTVYISENKFFSEAMALEMFDVDEQGELRTIGEIYRRAKNRLTSEFDRSNTNKLRYVLLGDPAMPIAAPSAYVELESIGAAALGGDEDVTVMARQNVVMRGTVYAADGRKYDSFNGMLDASIYDAEHTVTTLGRDIDKTEGKVYNFERQGDRLFVGRDSIRSGEFELRVSMPADVADNYRPAAFDMYAMSSDGVEAIGHNRDFYVYGYDDSALSDTLSPIIHQAYLNVETFVDGDDVDETPMFIASVSDDVAINLSMAGIGRQMSISVDGKHSYTDVADSFTPYPSGQPGGSVAYRLPEQSPGAHSLEYKVWDTSGNSASAQLLYNVVPGLSPTIYTVYTDANPARSETNFYISHNRPDAVLTVMITVYDMAGRIVWTTTATDKSDMLRSAPIKWDLRNMGGARVGRGIYPYKVSIVANGVEQASASGKVAVTGR